MSKGLGATQRTLLRTLTERRAAIRPELWYALPSIIPGGRHAPRSVLVSWRRAAHGLDDRGLIELRPVPLRVSSDSEFYHGSSGPGERVVCLVRLPLSDHDRVVVGEMQAQAERHRELLGLPRTSVNDRSALTAAPQLQLRTAAHDPSFSATAIAARWIAAYYEPLVRGALPDLPLAGMTLVEEAGLAFAARQIPAEVRIAHAALRAMAR
jgi:hypothetical protein